VREKDLPTGTRRSVRRWGSHIPMTVPVRLLQAHDMVVNARAMTPADRDNSDILMTGPDLKSM